MTISYQELLEIVNMKTIEHADYAVRFYYFY